MSHSAIRYAKDLIEEAEINPFNFHPDLVDICRGYLKQPPLHEFMFDQALPDGRTVYVASHEIWNVIEVTFPAEYWRPGQPVDRVLIGVVIPEAGVGPVKEVHCFDYQDPSEAEQFIDMVDRSKL